MAYQETWTKAVLTVKKTDGGEDHFPFQFNPKDYTISVGAKWKDKSVKGGLLEAEYNGPIPQTVSLEMFLDETDKDSGDVSTTVNRLCKYVNPSADSASKDKPTAPKVEFQWGESISFEGYISAISAKYTLFRTNGKPVRGTINITLKQFAKPEERTNPTSGGEPGSRSHKVVAGDTLASIAFNEYGAAGYWRKIADANVAIDDPMRLRPGASLLIPPA